MKEVDIVVNSMPSTPHQPLDMLEKLVIAACVEVLVEGDLDPLVEEVVTLMLTPKRWILVLDKGKDVVEGGRGELALDGPGEVWCRESHCNTVPLSPADFYW
jgi:hypothetical protein